MHAMTIVARVLGGCLSEMHAKRSASLMRSVAGLVLMNVASASVIARGLSGPRRFKHRLKSVDRLLGNSAMHGRREDIYRALAREWLAGLEHVLIVVDWSDLRADRSVQLLRASVVVQGRSVTLYEEIHAQRLLGNAKVHERFVKRLRAFLPIGCRPMVMTDAGFHAPWFKLIEAQGWSFVGRLRGRNRVKLGTQPDWVSARALYAKAQLQAQDLGSGWYARSNPVKARMVLTQRPAQGRHRRNARGTIARSSHSQKNARSNREPSLLACSVALTHLSAQAIIALYAQRMRIEQSFRDTKSAHFGLGLEHSRSRSAKRLEMLLLIVHLAAFVQRLVGECAKNKQLELQFMATRRKSRPEISLITLGRRILAAAHAPFYETQFDFSRLRLRKQAQLACTSFIQNAG